MEAKWHNASCPRPDLVTNDGVQYCLRCGSFVNLIIHPPLKNQSDFRLIRLFSGELEEDVRCEVYVEEDFNNAIYDAVSYTWGDETGDATQCKSIYISGQPFRVTRNCELALKRIRRHANDERQHQVGLMRLIYSRAREVLVYAGESSDGCDQWLSRVAVGDYVPSGFHVSPIVVYA
ncbi:heterokaryon incompatibility protein-domain-containing protein [Xylariaceae sp. FL0255]|nr:heterokaryon incompatibility protein-domain-containing protein [Xylariaceae sp. FL0255]